MTNSVRLAAADNFSEFAVIALGSNLADSERILVLAMERLQAFSSKPLLKSSLWTTTPLDCPPDSPPFINAVAALEPGADETPESLLKRLQKLEAEFGRQPKKIHNEPRILDLDLITFGTARRTTTELILPHPRAHLRRFVLQPLNEFAPNLVLPGQSKSVFELLHDLPAQGEVSMKRAVQ